MRQFPACVLAIVLPSLMPEVIVQFTWPESGSAVEYKNVDKEHQHRGLVDIHMG